MKRIKLTESQYNLLNEKLLLKNWDEYCKLVADAYDAAPDHDTSVLKHWEALNQSNYQWFNKLQRELKITYVTTNTKYKDNPSKINIAGRDFDLIYYANDPYSSQPEMKKDYTDNKRLFISIDYSDHPFFSVTDNIVFRLVHDYLIHIKGNFSFETGEINSYNCHVKLAPKDAVPALFTEIVGQAGYVMARGTFPDKQKICVLKGFDFFNVGKVEDHDIEDKTLAMKKIKINESQYKMVLKSLTTESMFNKETDGGEGKVEISKKNLNPADVKKLTDKGLEVQIIDEVLGEEQPVTFRHKFIENKKQKGLHIFSTKEKVETKAVLEYIKSIKETDGVRMAFESGNVNLNVKSPSSGRYSHLGSFTKNALEEYENILNNNSDQANIPLAESSLFIK